MRAIELLKNKGSINRIHSGALARISMVRSKRKWKKDSPEKLTARIEKGIEKDNEVRLSKLKPKLKPTSPDITSPENKKSKGPKELSTESSFDTLETSLIICDSQTSEEGGVSHDIDSIAVPLGNNQDKALNTEIDPEKIMDPNLNAEGNTNAPVEMPEKHDIGDTLKAITQSLNTLTQSVSVITNSMVSKTDLTEMKKSIDDHEKKLIENAQSLSEKMTKEEGKVLRKKVIDHDKILKSQEEDLEKITQSLKHAMNKENVHEEKHTKISNRLDGMSKSNENMKSELSKEIDELKLKMAKQEAELTSLKNGQRVINTPLNVPVFETNQLPSANSPPHQYQARLNIIIEGLKEEENEDLMTKVLSLCNKAGAKVEANDIAFVSRLVRKIPLGKKPNPVKVCFRELLPKERVMRAKYNLKKYEETENIWLNHDEPAHIRRIKGRARFIASYARKKGSSAQLTPSGIVLDNVFYNYDNLVKIPSIYIPPKTLILPPRNVEPNQSAEPMDYVTQNQSNHDGRSDVDRGQSIGHSHTAPNTTPNRVYNQPRLTPQSNSPKVPRVNKEQKMRKTTSGLVYSGPTAIFSHLYKARFVIDDTPYNSVEQRLQSEKAKLAKDLQAYDDIMSLHDTWGIKQRGDRVKATKEYIDMKLHIAGGANEAKFHQNPDLLEFLIETGEVTLIEGTTNSFWAGGEHYNSDAYENEDIHGKNNQGILVMRTRRNEAIRRARSAT